MAPDRLVKPLASAAALVAGLLLAGPLSAHDGHAHDGHAHGAVPLPAAQPAASRVAAVSPAAMVTLPARVVADPRRTLVLAAPQAGNIVAPASGLPQAGRLVRAGEVLARLQPAIAQPQRRDLERQLADARRDTGLGYLQIDRYGIEAQKFDVSLPTQTLQIITDYRAAQARQQQLEQSLGERLDIAAPRAGRLLRVEAASGRQYASGEPLFVVQADDGLAIETRFVDADLVAPEQATALLDDGRLLLLHRLGSGYDRAQRTQVALYAASGTELALQVNQRLRLQFPLAAGAGR